MTNDVGNAIWQQAAAKLETATIIGQRTVAQLTQQAVAELQSVDPESIAILPRPVAKLPKPTMLIQKFIDVPIGVADYELTRALPKELASSLPSIEDIETELTESLKEQAE